MMPPNLFYQDTQLNSQTKRTISPLRAARAHRLVRHLIHTECSPDLDSTLPPRTIPLDNLFYQRRQVWLGWRRGIVDRSIDDAARLGLIRLTPTLTDLLLEIAEGYIADGEV
jgi:hypothetical protein